MSFFAVLLALLLEQLKPLPRGNRVHEALTAWMRWTGRNFDAGRESHAWVVWSVAVLVPPSPSGPSTSPSRTCGRCWRWPSTSPCST